MLIMISIIHIYTFTYICFAWHHFLDGIHGEPAKDYHMMLYDPVNSRSPLPVTQMGNKKTSQDTLPIFANLCQFPRLSRSIRRSAESGGIRIQYLTKRHEKLGSPTFSLTRLLFAGSLFAVKTCSNDPIWSPDIPCLLSGYYDTHPMGFRNQV